MTCDEVRDWLSAAMDGEAAAHEQMSVDGHLAGCAECCRARDAALVLRQRLASASWKSGDALSQNEAVLALLRREGRTVRSLPASVLYLLTQRTRSGALSLQPALAAMALSFLVTWSALRWAERRPSDWSTRRPASQVVAASRVRRTELMARWLAGPPTLAALARLERSYAAKPVSPNTRRSAVLRLRRRVG